MLPNKIGFIGGGRVTRIILGGWRHAGVIPLEKVRDLIEQKVKELLAGF